MPRRFTFGDCLLLGAIMSHLWTFPFTKVEESFNMQAMNDLLSHGLTLDHFDHLSFPGVVPRTFLGAILVSIFAYLPSQMTSTPVLNLYLCRGCLGLLVWFSLVHVRSAISRKYGGRVAFFFCLLLSFQFHIPFYSTRSLPNTFALLIANHSFALWLTVRTLLGFISLILFSLLLLLLYVYLASR
jgi:alpha-1,6-mannosyltransferase